MLINKTILAANIFAAEYNIRPTLAGVFITPEKELVATNSFIACVFKPDTKEAHEEYPNIGIQEFQNTEPFQIRSDIIKKLKFIKNKNIPILESKILGNLTETTIEIGETDLNREIKVKTKIPQVKMPDIKNFIPKREEIDVEICLSLEFLEEILKALKIVRGSDSSQWVKISMKTERVPGVEKLTTLAPVKIEIYGQEEKGAAIIMPLKLNN